MPGTSCKPEFKAFPKIPRLRRALFTITEKIDGTNAVVFVAPDGGVHAGSRNRWITPDNGNGNDNYGFAGWVKDNEDDLRQLGLGYHYGEWWGHRIQRGYGLDERRFSLFDVREYKPACCHVVPVLHTGESMPSLADVIKYAELLREQGSIAAPGFARPEGVVLKAIGTNARYKYTFDGDAK